MGVAREFKNLNGMRARLAKENWSWLQLYDLDDKHQVWKQYGLPDGGGQLVLIDRNGNMVSMDAKVEEKKAYLEKELNSAHQAK